MDIEPLVDVALAAIADLASCEAEEREQRRVYWLTVLIRTLTSLATT